MSGDEMYLDLWKYYLEDINVKFKKPFKQFLGNYICCGFYR